MKNLINYLKVIINYVKNMLLYYVEYKCQFCSILFKKTVFIQEGEMKKQLADVNQQYTQLKEDDKV